MYKYDVYFIIMSWHDIYKQVTTDKNLYLSYIDLYNKYVIQKKKLEKDKTSTYIRTIAHVRREINKIKMKIIYIIDNGFDSIKKYNKLYKKTNIHHILVEDKDKLRYLQNFYNWMNDNFHKTLGIYKMPSEKKTSALRNVTRIPNLLKLVF